MAREFTHRCATQPRCNECPHDGHTYRASAPTECSTSRQRGSLLPPCPREMLPVSVASTPPPEPQAQPLAPAPPAAGAAAGTSWISRGPPGASAPPGENSWLFAPLLQAGAGALRAAAAARWEASSQMATSPQLLRKPCCCCSSVSGGLPRSRLQPTAFVLLIFFSRAFFHRLVLPPPRKVRGRPWAQGVLAVEASSSHKAGHLYPGGPRPQRGRRGQSRAGLVGTVVRKRLAKGPCCDRSKAALGGPRVGSNCAHARRTTVAAAAPCHPRAARPFAGPAPARRHRAHASWGESNPQG